MIRVRNLRLAPGEKETRLLPLAAKALRCPVSALNGFRIVKKSLDARKSGEIHWLYTVAVSAEEEGRLLARANNPDAAPWEPFAYRVPKAASEHRPVVAGFGPAGMFAALLLAEAGLRPVVLERGADVDTRRERVRRFWETGELDENTNVQFGEGGAGTFSDGKLATNTHDPRISWVLERFRDFGAGESVTWDARPHVGTDRLARVVKNLREHIISLGGEVRFRTCLTGFDRDDTGAVKSARTGAGEIPCRDLVLALGHSARDTVKTLLALGVPMEPKPFSMGVRVEHPQVTVDAARYGRARGKWLPPAEYQGNAALPDGNSAYTFCMCPGGYVVAASSEAGGVVTNGMSYSGRAGENANAALLVTLRPEDFPGSGPLAGMEWQREIERRCFAVGGGNYRAPAQTVGDFLSNRPGTGPGAVKPTYRPGVAWCDLREALPPKITDTLAAALPELAKRRALAFFASPDAVLTAPETRSSSPVRLTRDGGLQSPGIPGLYPCGEGAGYAGGITSAAVDGLRCAEMILKRYAAGEGTEDGA